VSGHVTNENEAPQGVHRLLWQPLLPVDPYIVDTLMPDLVGHDRQPSAFLVYLYLWRQTDGAGAAHTQVALVDIAESTGLSKRSVQDALGHLAKRKLITVSRASITAVPVYSVLRPWRR
jgi:Helix-turn-helix domain